MLSIGAFVHTTRSADLCYVMRSNPKKDELRICRLLDGHACWLPSKHVIAEVRPADRFREHVRAVIDQEKAPGGEKKPAFSNFAEYLTEYVECALRNGSIYVLDGVLNFLVIVLSEQDNGEYGRSFDVFFQDVNWFCYQLGMDSPSESLVKSRLISISNKSVRASDAGSATDEV
ncbi:hypothetical protein [Pseudomonas fulva]|uniref:hypothetical protein n=1 Tax=Pseudomonas fulva TaxID=47880 RepID=UPI00384A7308